MGKSGLALCSLTNHRQRISWPTESFSELLFNSIILETASRVIAQLLRLLSSYRILSPLNNSFLMSAQSPLVVGKGGVPASSSSVWDKISTWASENKAVVYTIAGVAVVVTGAGVAYYLTDSV